MMKNKLLLILLLGALLWNNQAIATEKDAANQSVLLEKIKKLEQQIAELTALKMKKQSIPAKRDQCMKVVGIESYCNCVVEKLPVSVDYHQFVSLLLTPSKELGYDAMTAEQRKNIDLALIAWAKCVDYKGPTSEGFIDSLMKRDTLF